MATYRVTGVLTISVSTKVLAKSADEAIARAMLRGVQRLCYQCANGEDTVEWVTSGELDGTPEELAAEVED